MTSPCSAAAMLTLLLLLLVRRMDVQSKRLYEHQFPPGSEHLITPPIALFSVFMGKWKYSHTELLFESMRWNPMVDFIIIYVVPSPEANSTDYLRATAAQLQVTNLHIVPLSLGEWNARVKDRLGIDVNFTAEWYYKLCDYKPTLAHMFPEWVSEDKYAYWGYGDLDVIWGNFSRYSSWFQGRYFVVISGWWGTTGAAAFYMNGNWSRQLFMQDPMYVLLLKNQTYHNLDEGGMQTKPENVFDRGVHSISSIQKTYRIAHNLEFNRGLDWRDHCFYDPGDTASWAGPIVWFRGSLKVIHGSPYFPPGRELLFFHRMEGKIDGFPEAIRRDLIQEMIQYGYLLPSYVPLLSSHMCRMPEVTSALGVEALHKYHPYAPECFGGHHMGHHANQAHHPHHFHQGHAHVRTGSEIAGSQT